MIGKKKSKSRRHLDLSRRIDQPEPGVEYRMTMDAGVLEVYATLQKGDSKRGQRHSTDEPENRDERVSSCGGPEFLIYIYKSNS